MAKVLVLGSGGREHTLGWKLAQSPHVSEVLHAPGNPGTEMEKKGRNVSIDPTKKENFPELEKLVKLEKIDMIVVGPEKPLDVGIVDYFYSKDYNSIVGPTKTASGLESDKFYSFELMRRLGTPQANGRWCLDIGDVENVIKTADFLDRGVVLKARGLTEGKGVSVYKDREEALADLEKFVRKFDQHILVSERLFGQEFSVIAFSDSKNVYPIPIAFQDHKPVFDGDRGPNTGGMGAYGPSIGSDVVRNFTQNHLTRLVRKMKKDNVEYKGIVYAGMMMTSEGPKVLEINCRFPDPETQPAMMLMKNDLYKLLSDSLDGKELDIQVREGASCCVVLASKGYPGQYSTGFHISGIKEAEKIPGVKVFHAGTRLDDGQLVTKGGRVLNVTSYSPEGFKKSQELSYEAANIIKVSGGLHYRKDIGNKALKF